MGLKERREKKTEAKTNYTKKFREAKLLGKLMLFARRRPIVSAFVFLGILSIFGQLFNGSSRPSQSQMSVAEFEQKCRGRNTSDCDNQFVVWDGYFKVEYGSTQLISLFEATPVIFNERTPGAFTISVSDKELTNTPKSGLRVPAIDDGFHYGTVSGFLKNFVWWILYFQCKN